MQVVVVSVGARARGHQLLGRVADMWLDRHGCLHLSLGLVLSRRELGRRHRVGARSDVLGHSRRLCLHRETFHGGAEELESLRFGLGLERALGHFVILARARRLIVIVTL